VLLYTALVIEPPSLHFKPEVTVDELEFHITLGYLLVRKVWFRR